LAVISKFNVQMMYPPGLKNIVATPAATWTEEIPWVLLGLHAQLREDTGLSPAEAVFGAPIVFPNEFLKGGEIPVVTI
jgi:hypothetical protein